MASAGLVRPGIIRPTPLGQAPAPTLPGSNLADPSYAEQKQGYDRQAQRTMSGSQANARGKADFLTAANSGANYDSDFTDSDTGVSMHHAAEGPKFGDTMQQFDQLMTRFNTKPMSGRGSLPPQVSFDQAGADAGQAAAYSQAKDKVGGATQGLMKSLQNQFASRGLRGSSIEGQQIGSALEQGAGQLDDVARTQAIEGTNRATDIAKTKFSGGITQRGQDIDADTADRQIEANSGQSRTASILGLFNAVKGLKARY